MKELWIICKFSNYFSLLIVDIFKSVFMLLMKKWKVVQLQEMYNYWKYYSQNLHYITYIHYALKKKMTTQYSLEHAKSYDLCPADEGHDQAVPQPPHHPQSPCQDWGRHHGKDPIPWPGKSGRVELGLNLNGGWELGVSFGIF